jgi:hypothetical protein
MRHRLTVGSSVLALALLCLAGCTETGTDSAAPVADQWTSLGQNSASTYANHGEHTLSPSNVGALELDWHFVPAGSVNGAAAVVNGVVYILSSGGLSPRSGGAYGDLAERRSVAARRPYDNGRFACNRAPTSWRWMRRRAPSCGVPMWRILLGRLLIALVFERVIVGGCRSRRRRSPPSSATWRSMQGAAGASTPRHYPSTVPA